MTIKTYRIYGKPVFPNTNGVGAGYNHLNQTLFNEHLYITDIRLGIYLGEGWYIQNGGNYLRKLVGEDILHFSSETLLEHYRTNPYFITDSVSDLARIIWTNDPNVDQRELIMVNGLYLDITRNYLRTIRFHYEDDSSIPSLYSYNQQNGKEIIKKYL